MTERIYMVEQIESARSRVLTCYATYDLAEAEVLRLIAQIPYTDDERLRYPWTEQPNLKRMSCNHGTTEMIWTSRMKKHVSAFAVVSFEVQGSAVDRLGALARG